MRSFWLSENGTDNSRRTLRICVQRFFDTRSLDLHSKFARTQYFSNYICICNFLRRSRLYNDECEIRADAAAQIRDVFKKKNCDKYHTSPWTPPPPCDEKKYKNFNALSRVLLESIFNVFSKNSWKFTLKWPKMPNKMELPLFFTSLS